MSKAFIRGVTDTLTEAEITFDTSSRSEAIGQSSNFHLITPTRPLLMS